MVSVGFCGTLCDFEIAFVGYLVEGGFAAAEELAGVAVAERSGEDRSQLIVLTVKEEEE